MSPTSKSSFTPEMVKSTTSSPSGSGRGDQGRSGNGSHGNDCPNPSRTGMKPIDFDANKYNNPPIKLFLVFPGETALTQAFSSTTIPSKRFLVSTNHESTHMAAKQAIYDNLTQTLLKIFPMGKEIKEAIHA